MNRIAIIGHEAAKFTKETEAQARRVIRLILSAKDAHLVSGGCHIGGVDIYAEEEADSLGLDKTIHLPKKQAWSGGYKERNLKIATDCNEAHCIVVRELPSSYKGMTFTGCYHCHDTQPPHIKSGGCWTVIRAGRQGKPTFWHIIGDEE